MALLHRTEPGPETAGFSLRALEPALRWRPADELVRVVSTSAFRRLGQALGATVAGLARAGLEEGEAAAAAMRDLPNPAFFRLIIAPEVFRLLSGAAGADGPTQAGFFARSLEAERALLGEAPARSVWTALGDAFFSTDPSDGPSLRAPRLALGAALDAHSPQALGIEEPRCGPALPFAEGDEAALPGKLDAALRGLAATAPHAAALVRSFTRVVVPRRDGLVPDTFRSSSTNAAIGRTLLVNPHLPDVDALDLADALLHEGIHHALYSAELIRPMLRDKAACAELACPSPWTGNPLSVHNYAHASLVWAGLWSVWSRPEAREHFDPARVRARVAYLEAGFAKGRLRAALEPVAEHLDPDLLDLIDALQDGIPAGR